MKIKYCIYIIGKLEICVPDDSYYSSPNNWNKEDIKNLSWVFSADTHEECLAELQRISETAAEIRELYGRNPIGTEEYIILPTYLI